MDSSDETFDFDDISDDDILSGIEDNEDGERFSSTEKLYDLDFNVGGEQGEINGIIDVEDESYTTSEDESYVEDESYTTSEEDESYVEDESYTTSEDESYVEDESYTTSEDESYVEDESYTTSEEDESYVEDESYTTSEEDESYVEDESYTTSEDERILFGDTSGNKDNVFDDYGLYDEDDNTDGGQEQSGNEGSNNANKNLSFKEKIANKIDKIKKKLSTSELVMSIVFKIEDSFGIKLLQEKQEEEELGPPEHKNVIVITESRKPGLADYLAMYGINVSGVYTDIAKAKRRLLLEDEPFRLVVIEEGRGKFLETENRQQIFDLIGMATGEGRKCSIFYSHTIIFNEGRKRYRDMQWSHYDGTPGVIEALSKLNEIYDGERCESQTYDEEKYLQFKGEEVKCSGYIHPKNTRKIRLDHICIEPTDGLTDDDLVEAFNITI